MPETPQFLADRLLTEGDRVTDFFKNLTKDQWMICIYQQEDHWDMHDLLAHFVSAEIGRKTLIANIALGGEGAPPGFKIDSFNHEEVERFSGESNDSLLELFLQERSQLITLVSGLSLEDLQRVGRDPFLGEVPLVDMIKLTYRHLQIHLRDARRLIQSENA